MTSLDLRGNLDRFWSWWLGELAGMLPRGLGEGIRRRARRLVVDLDGAAAAFRVSDAREVHDIGILEFGADAVASSAAAEQIRRACDRRINEVALRVSAKQALRRTLAMPLAAETNLRAVLAFEMDRYTPFKAEHVYYDFAVLARNPEKRSLQVALTVVPRKAIDPLVQALRSWGLEPTSLEVQGADAEGLNLLPAAQRALGRGGARWQLGVLAGIAALLLVTALALPVAQKMQTVDRLQKEVEEIRKEALLAAQVRKQLEQLDAEESALLIRRNQRPAAIDVLQEMTRLLPDQSWLNQLELAGTRVKIHGEAPNASELVTSIENSALFKGASFDGSVTRDPKADRERFAISATVREMKKP